MILGMPWWAYILLLAVLASASHCVTKWAVARSVRRKADRLDAKWRRTERAS